MLFSLTTMKQFSIGVLVFVRSSIVFAICCGDFGVNLRRIMPFVLSLCSNTSLPKSVSKVMITLPCLFARSSASRSLKLGEICRIGIMSMFFCFKAFTALIGMFSSARNLVKEVGKPFLLSKFRLRTLKLRLCLPF